MSRYLVNKLMRAVNMDPDLLARYRDEPADVVAAFVAEQPAGTLAAEEANALAGKDYGALYALGAHPYLLWSFTEAALVPPMSRAELVDSFRRAAAETGYPDFATTPLPALTARD